MAAPPSERALDEALKRKGRTWLCLKASVVSLLVYA